MIDSLNREWHYLGFAYFSTLDAVALATALTITITPSSFRDFILSCTHPTRAQIFNTDPQLPAILHHAPEEDNILDEDSIENSLQNVTLSFEYCYVIDIPFIGGKYYATPGNALGCYFDDLHLGLDLLHKTPDFSTAVLKLYGGFHDHGVDLQVRYRWTQSPNSSTGMVLRLRIDQDPIPEIPTDAPPPEAIGWNLLSNPVRLIPILEDNNELIVGMNVMEFLQSFPEGQIRDEFYKGKGIRASNVYTPSGVVKGSQVKVQFEEGFYLVRISIATILVTNRHIFSGKMIEVFYRWRGVALELMLQLAPGED